MNTLLYTSNMISLVNTMGTNLIIKSLTTTTSSLCSLVVYLTATNHPQIIKKIKKLDLPYKVSIIGNVLTEYKTDEIQSIAIKQSIIGVQEILEMINNELITLKDIIDTHNSKYFSNWRYLDCYVNVKLLKKYNKILDNRYKMLIELLQIL
jgi:lysophospholipase L1-like esterase